MQDLDITNKNRRGFTDHEHLNEQQLIHMNGRVYDYNLGRFLSVDPLIQSPTSTQSVNPYSYIMNNPLAGTDPTGYCATTDNVQDCADSIESGTTQDITDKDGKTVGTVGKDSQGNMYITKGNGASAHQGIQNAMSSAGNLSDMGSLKQTAAKSGGDGVTAKGSRAGINKTSRGTDVGEISEGEKDFVNELENGIVNEYFSLVERINDATASGNEQLSTDLEHAINGLRMATWSYTNEYAADGSEAKTTTTFIKDAAGNIVAEKVYVIFYRGAYDAYKNGSPANVASGYHVSLNAGVHAIRGLIVHEIAHSIPRVNVTSVNGGLRRVPDKRREGMADSFLKSVYPKEY
nr:RHS repeat-associated core domain-containing protein [Shewanella sp. 10B]